MAWLGYLGYGAIAFWLISIVVAGSQGTELNRSEHLGYGICVLASTAILSAFSVIACIVWHDLGWLLLLVVAVVIGLPTFFACLRR